jgi:hypothetical protein
MSKFRYCELYFVMASDAIGKLRSTQTLPPLSLGALLHRTLCRPLLDCGPVERERDHEIEPSQRT